MKKYFYFYFAAIVTISLFDDASGGNFFTIRQRDSTGHRTGLGTMGRSFLRDPIGTIKSWNSFTRNYKAMRAANIRGGNLKAHEKANYEATRIMGNPRLASAISAFREQSKRFRSPASTSRAARKGWGDMRTPSEIRSTMNANKAGRDRAMAEIRRQRG